MSSKILIVRFSSIGDIVLTSPIVRCVHRQLGAEVHFLTKTKFKTLLQHNPYLTKCYGINNKISEVITELKAENYDYVIDLHKNLRTQDLKFRLGVKSYSFDKLNIEKWLRVNLKIDKLPQKHLVDRYFEGLRELQIENDGKGLDHFISPSEQEEANAIVGALNKYNVLVLGANYYTKRIPTALSEQIITKASYSVVLLGGKDVKSEAEILAEKYPVETINLVGKTSLAISAGIIRKSHEVHSGDTGLMHIAAAYKKKIHTYWGNTTPELGMYAYLPKTAPKRTDHQVLDLSCRPCSKLGYDKCPKTHFKCMLDIKI